MPNAVKHFHLVQQARAQGRKRTAHAAGQYFRLFGSRVNQAILAYLAACGPSNITKLCAAINASDVNAAVPLIEAGLVCQVMHASGRVTRTLSLNAAHPIYRPLRALLRTEAIQKDAFPVESLTSMFIGEDLREDRKRFLPYTLFGVSHQVLGTKVLAYLAHTKHKESNPSRLSRLLGASRKHANGVQAVGYALRRLEDYGVLKSRMHKGLHRYRFAEDYASFGEFLELLDAMGKQWPEFAEGAGLEDRLFADRRSTLERGRTWMYKTISNPR